MKYIKTYKIISSKPKFKVGDLVKINTKTLSKRKLFNINVTENELKKKTFIIVKYDKHRESYEYKKTPYLIENINKNDKFEWGWTYEEYIKPAPQKDIEQYTTDKYNL